MPDTSPERVTNPLRVEMLFAADWGPTVRSVVGSSVFTDFIDYARAGTFGDDVADRRAETVEIEGVKYRIDYEGVAPGIAAHLSLRPLRPDMVSPVIYLNYRRLPEAVVGHSGFGYVAGKNEEVNLTAGGVVNTDKGTIQRTISYSKDGVAQDEVRSLTVGKLTEEGDDGLPNWRLVYQTRIGSLGRHPEMALDLFSSQDGDSGLTERPQAHYIISATGANYARLLDRTPDFGAQKDRGVLTRVIERHAPTLVQKRVQVASSQTRR